jgi:hypothetical protein
MHDGTAAHATLHQLSPLHSALPATHPALFNPTSSASSSAPLVPCTHSAASTAPNLLPVHQLKSLYTVIDALAIDDRYACTTLKTMHGHGQYHTAITVAQCRCATLYSQKTKNKSFVLTGLCERNKMGRQRYYWLRQCQYNFIPYTKRPWLTATFACIAFHPADLY